MKKEDFYIYLCCNDRRNPNFTCMNCFQENCTCLPIDSGEKTIEQQKECSCDNCFYGRSYLANVIISLLK